MRFKFYTLALFLAPSLLAITEMGANTRLGLFFPDLFGIEKREATIQKLGVLSQVVQVKNFESHHAITSAAGNHVRVQKLEAEQVIGASVKGPEVGMILSEYSKGKLKRATVLHFTSGDHADKTLTRLGPFQKDSHVVIFGGDGSNDSNTTLQSIQAFLERNPHLKVDGYADISNLWLTFKGGYLSSPNDPLS